MGLDATAIDGLIARARREVDEGLLPSAQADGMGRLPNKSICNTTINIQYIAC